MKEGRKDEKKRRHRKEKKDVRSRKKSWERICFQVKAVILTLFA
jgi:hypothetical protein